MNDVIEPRWDLDVLGSVTRWVLAARARDYVAIGDAAQMGDDQRGLLDDETIVAHPHTALLWALAKAEKVEPLDVGSCSVCPIVRGMGPVRRMVVVDLRQYPNEWRCLAARPRLQRCANAMARDGYLDRAPGESHSAPLSFRLACCKNTGRELRTATSLVLRCGPVPMLFTGGRHLWGSRGGESWYRTDDDLPPPALPIDHLHVLADREQAAGRRWGTWVAQWLADKFDWLNEAVAALDAHWEALTVECDRCAGTGRVTTYSSVFSGTVEVPGPGPGRTTDCEECSGRGRVRGSV